uniref:Uncharacterized protein n=1 Tax=Chrysemys picta bellii TaxID=8478 RepID=A0A8C3I431_CHRPI
MAELRLTLSGCLCFGVLNLRYHETSDFQKVLSTPSPSENPSPLMCLNLNTQRSYTRGRPHYLSPPDRAGVCTTAGQDLLSTPSLWPCGFTMQGRKGSLHTPFLPCTVT